MKRIAVAAVGNDVAQHFGYCENFMIYDVEDGKIVRVEIVLNPGHKPGFLPAMLAKREVNVIIAGGMGGAAADIFGEHHIETVVGASGDTTEAVNAYIRGELKSTGEVCHEHTFDQKG